MNCFYRDAIMVSKYSTDTAGAVRNPIPSIFVNSMEAFMASDVTLTLKRFSMLFLNSINSS